MRLSRQLQSMIPIRSSRSNAKSEFGCLGKEALRREMWLDEIAKVYQVALSALDTTSLSRELQRNRGDEFHLDR